MIYHDHYAGFWTGKDHGGHLFGVVEPEGLIEAPNRPASPSGDLAALEKSWLDYMLSTTPPDKRATFEQLWGQMREQTPIVSLTRIEEPRCIPQRKKFNVCRKLRPGLRRRK
jgi:hypothetical protein